MVAVSLKNSLGTPYAAGVALKRPKKQKNNNNKKKPEEVNISLDGLGGRLVVAWGHAKVGWPGTQDPCPLIRLNS